VNEGKQAAPNGSEIVFQADSTSLSLAKLRIYGGILSTFKVPNTLTSVSFESCASCTVGIGLANTFIVFTGFNVADPSNDRGHVLWDNRWAKFVNHATGTDFVVAGNLPDEPRNKGLCEVRQGVTFAATSGSGAKFYTKDTNNGSRLAANQIGTNPDYVADRTYTLTESAGAASYTTDGGVLTGVHWRTIGGLQNANNRFDSRGIANDKTDIFTWMKVEYGQQPATSNIIMKGTSAVTAEIQSLPDLGVTEADRAVVAAYTGITPVYSGGTLTVTVTQDHNWNEIYDYVKVWESQNPASVWANGKASFVSTANKLDYTFNNLALIVNGADVTCGDGQSLPTKPTVTNGGFFEDADGAIWDDAGDTNKASAFFTQILDVDTADKIEGATIGCGDVATQTRLLYNTSLALDTLVTDGDGEANGYLAYDLDGATFADPKLVVANYNHGILTIPLAATGLPVGTAAAPQAYRLTPDAQVTKTKAQAAAITGVTVDVPTDTIDLGGNTLADTYDSLKYKVTADADIDTGVPGCMYACLYGLPLGKAGTTYTARTATTIYQNVVIGANTFSGGVVEWDTPGTYAGGTWQDTTLCFTAAGTYTFSDSGFIGTIHLKNTSGGAVTVALPEGVTYVNDGPSITVIEPQIYQSVTITGLVSGYRVQLYDLTASTELYNDTVSGTSLTWTDDTPYTADRQIRLRIMYADGSAIKLEDRVIGTSTETTPGLAYAFVAEVDTVYGENNIDGSTVTGITITDATMRLEIDSGTVTQINGVDVVQVNAKNIYAYETWWLYTEEGIRDEARFIEAIDGANYKLHDFKIRNDTAYPVVIVGGYVRDAATNESATVVDYSGGAIHFAPDLVINNVVTVGGVNVITGDIADVPTATENATATRNAIIGDIPTAAITATATRNELADELSRITEIHKIQGLDASAPMTVTTTSRTAGGINLGITGDGTTTTTVERTL
jgi:hypothetical protein